MKRSIVLLLTTILIGSCCFLNPDKFCKRECDSNDENCDNVCVRCFCTNGVFDPDQGEEGIDCGGPCKQDCGARPPVATCNDNIQNGDEEGVDCGGSCPNDCDDDPPIATCNDNIQNGDEEGVDCGGSCPNDCDDDPPPTATCNDNIQNGDEEGVDCGGSCPNDCDDDLPPPTASCDDNIQNGDEAGIDCGGTNCRPCHCFDGIQNGDETSADCGGSCQACHCVSCQQDGDETGIDCGPSCDRKCPQNIDERKELMITNLNVVEDPIEALSTNGSFHIQTLFDRLAVASGRTAKEVMLQFLTSWEDTNLSMNGFNIAARPSIRSKVIDLWKQRDGQAGASDAAWNMNFANAPFRLLAIVNRFDLFDKAGSDVANAGEGRFVFCVVNPDGTGAQFTIIFEYKLPASNEAELIEWAERWHALATAGNFDRNYINALKAITDDFATCANLAQIRTNEVHLEAPWELREFNINCGNSTLFEVSRKLTPDDRFNNTERLRQFIENNADALNQDLVTFEEGDGFLAGKVTTPFPPRQFFWNAPGLSFDNTLARHRLSFNTCNGCHGGETQTDFTHIDPRNAGSEAQLSGFLEGICVDDPLTNIGRFFDDLRDRAVILEKFSQPSLESIREMDVSSIVRDRRNRTH